MTRCRTVIGWLARCKSEKRWAVDTGQSAVQFAQMLGRFALQLRLATAAADEDDSPIDFRPEGLLHRPQVDGMPLFIHADRADLLGQGDRPVTLGQPIDLGDLLA